MSWDLRTTQASMLTALLCGCDAEAAVDNKWRVNGLRAITTLFEVLKFKFHVIFTCHTILFFF